MKLAFLKNSLSMQLLKSIFGLYLLIAIIVTIIQVTLEFDSTTKDIKHQIKDLATTFTPALRDAVFDLDELLIDKIIMGIGENSFIVKVDLKDHHRKHLHTHKHHQINDQGFFAKPIQVKNSVA
jgi:ABC-type transport system involved in cytochrome bd biosynthesis fused ATPase/permease subunit